MIITVWSSGRVQLLSSKLPLLLREEQNLMVLMGSDTYPEDENNKDFFFNVVVKKDK